MYEVLNKDTVNLKFCRICLSSINVVMCQNKARGKLFKAFSTS